MNQNIFVDTDAIRVVAKNIDDKRQEIDTIYKNRMIPVLQQCAEYLKVSGLNYDDVSSSFNKVFESLNNQLNELTGALTEKIIPSYENASSIIKQAFNNEFAEELKTALNIMNK